MLLSVYGVSLVKMRCVSWCLVDMWIRNLIVIRLNRNAMHRFGRRTALCRRAPCRAVRYGTIGAVRVWYMGPKALGRAALRHRGTWAQGR